MFDNLYSKEEKEDQIIFTKFNFKEFKIRNDRCEKDDYKIFPNQDENALSIFNVATTTGFVNKLICLKADTQPGKTGSIFAWCQYMADYFKNIFNKNVKVLYFILDPHNSLKEQTQDRLNKMSTRHECPNLHFNTSFFVFNRSETKRMVKDHENGLSLAKILEKEGFKYNQDSDILLFVKDESHLGQKEQSLLDKFLKILGVTWGADPNTWKTKNIFCLDSSATDYSKSFINLHKSGFYKIVKFKNGIGYRSTRDNLNRLRTIQVHSMFDETDMLSKWMKRVLKYTFDTVMPKYWQKNSNITPVARIRVEDQDIAKYLRIQLENWGKDNNKKIEVEIFHSNLDNKGRSNISKLKEIVEKQYVSDVSEDLFVAIFCDAYSTGQTIGNLNSTVLAIESCAAINVNDGKLVQEAGRYTGYTNLPNYTLLCVHKPSLKRHADWLDLEDEKMTFKDLPSTTNMNGNKVSIKTRTRYKIIRNSNVNKAASVRKNYPEVRSVSRSSKQGTINDVKKGSHDQCRHILNGSRDTSASDAYNYGFGRTIHIDGPNIRHPAYEESYHDLINALKNGNGIYWIIDNSNGSIWKSNGELEADVIAIPIEEFEIEEEKLPALANDHMANRVLNE